MDMLEKHRAHVQSILEAILVKRLYLKQKRCEFQKDNAKYLNWIIKRDCLKLNSNKVVAVQNRSVLKSSFDI